MPIETPLVPAKAGTQGQDLDARWSLCSGEPKARPGYGHERIKEFLTCLMLGIGLAIALPAATRAGDFGRPKPSLLEGLIPRQFWQGPVTGYSGAPLTDLEIELRDRSYVLIRPNEPRGNWNIYIAG